MEMSITGVNRTIEPVGPSLFGGGRRLRLGSRVTAVGGASGPWRRPG